MLQIGQKINIPGGTSSAGVTTPVVTGAVSSSATDAAAPELDSNLLGNVPGDSSLPINPPTVNGGASDALPAALPVEAPNPDGGAAPIPPAPAVTTGAAGVSTTSVSSAPPNPQVVDRDQTLAEFAARYNVSEEAVRQLNVKLLENGNTLRAGSIVLLPAK